MYKLANLKKIYTSLPTSFLCRALQCSSWSSVIFIFECQGIKDTVSRNSKISFIWVNARFSWVPISLLLSPSLAFVEYSKEIMDVISWLKCTEMSSGDQKYWELIGHLIGYGHKISKVYCFSIPSLSLYFFSLFLDAWLEKLVSIILAVKSDSIFRIVLG